MKEGKKKSFPTEYFTFLNIRDGREEYFLSTSLFLECKKSRQAKLQFTIKKGSSFKAFE
jgi:hypothetical protein